MPAFNEGEHIHDNIMETNSVLGKDFDLDLVIVNDGSSDNTYSESLRAAEKLKNAVAVNLPVNVGKGNAIKEGFRHVKGDYVVFLDADLDLHPSQVSKLLKAMDGHKANVVIGSKYHPSSELNYPWIRKLISRVYALVLKILFNLPLRDTQTGLKIYEYEVLRRVFPKILCKRYAYDLELLVNAHRLGYSILEAPVVLNFRRPKKMGRMRPNDLYRTGLDTLAIFYRTYILKYYDSIKT